MSHDQDHDHNPWTQPTPKGAHGAILWLSGGLIAIGVTPALRRAQRGASVGLLAGQIAGVAGVITGALHRMCRRGLAADRAALTQSPLPRSWFDFFLLDSQTDQV